MEKAIYLTPEELIEKTATVTSNIIKDMHEKDMSGSGILLEMIVYAMFSVKLCKELFGKKESKTMEKAIYLTPEELSEKTEIVTGNIIDDMHAKGMSFNLALIEMLRFTVFSVKLREELFGKGE